MRYRIILSLICLHAINCYSQEKLTLQECVNYALKNNVSVKLADVQSRLSTITAKQSEMTRLPNLNGNINSAYQHGLTTNPTTNILESSSYISGSMNVQASYNIFNWSARKNSIAANNLYKKADEVGIDKARNDVSLAVANAFLQVMLRREQARISEVQMDQSKAQLENTINRLPSDQREVLILSKYQELPYKEIAEILKTTEGNVKVKVFRAVEELKKIYRKN